MKNVGTVVVMQHFCPRRPGLIVMLLAVCFAGCRTTDWSQRPATSAYADEIRRLEAADADAVVEDRTKQGNWRFLAYYSDQPDGQNVPGLVPEEMIEFLDSGFFETEVFFDERTLYVIEFEGDPKPWLDAKWHYADKVNRALVRKIRRTGRISAQIAAPTPSPRPPNK